jgi:DNA-binding NtrC family response regulator
VDEPIVVVGADKKQCKELRAILASEHYRITTLHSFVNPEENIHEGSCRAVIIDLDTVPVSNRDLRELKRKNPDIFIICLSKRKFHPELEEAISRHIYACLG